LGRFVVARVGVEDQTERIGALVVGGDLAVDVLGVVAEGRDGFRARQQPGANGGQHRVEFLLGIDPLPTLWNPFGREVVALLLGELRQRQRAFK
jgi:hypothetical protein